MAKRRMLKETHIYIDDHLSSYNSELFRHARHLKRENKLFSAWTHDCCVVIKVREFEQRFKLKILAELQRL